MYYLNLLCLIVFGFVRWISCNINLLFLICIYDVYNLAMDFVHLIRPSKSSSQLGVKFIIELIYIFLETKFLKYIEKK